MFSLNFNNISVTIILYIAISINPQNIIIPKLLKFVHPEKQNTIETIIIGTNFKNNSLYELITASFTTSNIFVLFNIIWLNFKSINIINIIAPIPSIDIITFVYLNNNDNNAINPTHDTLAKNPFDLYFIVSITNNTSNITATAPAKYNNCSFVIS